MAMQVICVYAHFGVQPAQLCINAAFQSQFRMRHNGSPFILVALQVLAEKAHGVAVKNLFHHTLGDTLFFQPLGQLGHVLRTGNFQVAVNAVKIAAQGQAVLTGLTKTRY